MKRVGAATDVGTVTDDYRIENPCQAVRVDKLMARDVKTSM